MKLPHHIVVPGQYERLWAHFQRTLARLSEEPGAMPCEPPQGTEPLKGIPTETKPLRHAPKAAIEFTFFERDKAIARVTYEDGVIAEHHILDCGNVWELVDSPVQLIVRCPIEGDPKETA